MVALVLLLASVATRFSTPKIQVALIADRAAARGGAHEYVNVAPARDISSGVGHMSRRSRRNWLSVIEEAAAWPAIGQVGGREDAKRRRLRAHHRGR